MKVRDPDNGQWIDTWQLCPLMFKGRACGYHGEADECSKTFRCCRALGNQVHFGGLPSMRTVEDAYKTEG